MKQTNKHLRAPKGNTTWSLVQQLCVKSFKLEQSQVCVIYRLQFFFTDDSRQGLVPVCYGKRLWKAKLLG